MSLIQLRTFVEVYRRRSISQAARVLHLTQPAVSQHISSLEAQLSRPLFDRHSRGVVPTPAADDLAASIGESLDRAEAALATAKARSGEMSGTVHIAAPADYLGEVIAPRLQALLQAGLQLRLHLGGKEAIYRLLLDDQVQLAIAASTPDDDRLAFTKIGEESFVAVARRDLVDQIEKDGQFEALRTMRLLAYDLDKPLVRLWAAANHVDLSGVPAVTIPDLRVLRTMVCAGLGWSVLPDYLAKGEGLIEIKPPITRPSNALNLVWAKSALRNPRISFARNLLVDVLQR
jgi:DNA-binding transcriptional LysR family regulator